MCTWRCSNAPLLRCQLVISSCAESYTGARLTRPARQFKITVSGTVPEWGCALESARRAGKVSRAFPGRFLGVSEVFRWRFRCVSGVFLRCFRGVPEVFPGCSRGVSEVFPMCFRCVSGVFPVCFRCVSGVFPGCLRGVSGVSPGCLRGGGGVWDPGPRLRNLCRRRSSETAKQGLIHRFPLQPHKCQASQGVRGTPYEARATLSGPGKALSHRVSCFQRRASAK
jgi:hypothetical protein